MSPYRTAPTRPVPPRRSWWTTARRLWAASKRRTLPNIASVRPTLIVGHVVVGFLATLGAYYKVATLALVVVALATSPTNDVLRVLWRWRAARRAIRIWSTRCLHRESGCLTCGGAHGEPCDPYTHEFAASGTAAGRDAAEVRRDNRIATRDAQATGVVTTFPAITAYREAARTGEWAAFAAKRTEPLVEALRPSGARVVAVETSSRGVEVTYEITIETGESRRGRTG